METIWKWMGCALILLCVLGCSKKTSEAEKPMNSEPTFLVKMESVSPNEDGEHHQVWVRWSLNGKEQGVKKVAQGVGGLSLCPMGQECPRPKGSPVTLSGYYGGVASSYELVRRGGLVVVEDATEDIEACGPEGCDEEGARRVFEIPVPKGASVELKAVE